MRAVRVDEFGGPGVLVVREVPDPVPGPGQVLVEVSGVNIIYLDTLIRSGLAEDHFPVTPPYVPGGGVSGRVVEGDRGLTRRGWARRSSGRRGNRTRRTTGPGCRSAATPSGQWFTRTPWSRCPRA